MILYILKSSACLLILISFYKFFLEGLSNHTFKRFYLLFGLVVALVIPLITFTEYVEVTPLVEPIIENEALTMIAEHSTVPEKTFEDYLPNIVLSVYLIGVLILGIRFILNLRNIIQKIRGNTKVNDGQFINVLLSNLVAPHTFFKFIFLNKHKYKAKIIPQEVFIHEQAHAKEYHSLDILITELFQIALWFNPLIYLIKKDIKLNHEFLADRAVLRHGFEVENYQETILRYSSADCPHVMANAFNYSSIKKRLLIMKTQTSKHAVLFRTFVIIPLIALMVYGFSSSKLEYVEQKDLNEIEILINENAEFEYNNEVISTAQLIELYRTNEKPDLQIQVFNNFSDEFYKALSTSFREHGIKSYTICKYDKALNQKKISDIELTEYNKIAKRLNKADYGKMIVKIKEKEFLEAVYGNMSQLQRNSAEPLPDFSKVAPIPTPWYENQDIASELEIKEYNSLAKKYNEMDKSNFFVKSEDVKRLNYLYSKMSEKQRRNAEPFPDFPEPPPAPDAPLTEKVKNIISESPPQPTPPLNKEKYSKDRQNEFIEVPTPPTPPKPKNPIDHIKEMAKKGATFYLDGKKITSDEAIKALESNKSLNISSRTLDNGNPEVRITKRGILVKPREPQDKNIIINGTEQKSGTIVLDLNQISDLKLEMKGAKIIGFKMKIPGVKSINVKGNMLDDTAKSQLDNIQVGDGLQLFDIKTDDNKKNPPILIEVKD